MSVVLYCFGFWISMWMRLKSLVTLQHLASPVLVFSAFGYNFWQMYPGKKIWTVCMGNSGQTMNLCPNWGTPCSYSVFCSVCLSLIQLVEMKKRKIWTSKPKSEVLHASLKEQPLLLSISWDPSFTPKINKFLCIVLFSKDTKAKEEKGFMSREVKQETPPGYWLGLLEVEQCSCSSVTLSGYCLCLLTTEQHQRWKIILYKS